MNFTTFTGSSRRPRNVNLSGQPSNPNPFAASAWNAPGDPSRTVFQAQAERQQRQRERERLQAAKKIQRVYRGSVARAEARELHRDRFDHVYRNDSPMAGVDIDATERVNTAFPHVVRSFKLSEPNDIERLSRMCDDLAAAGVSLLETQPAPRITQFFNSLLDVINKTQHTDKLPESASQLDVAVSILRTFPHTTLSQHTINRYYKLLARLSSKPNISTVWSAAAVQASLAPFKVLSSLSDDSASTDLGRNTYHAFAFHYLATPKLVLFEENCAIFSESVSVEALSSAITDGYSQASANATSADPMLWLLAHLVQLYSTATTYKTEAILSPLYMLLSNLGREIRYRLAPKTDSEDPYYDGTQEKDESAAQLLPDYIKAQLQSLVSIESIQHLLGQLSGQRDTAETTKTVNLLSGYLLALLNYFPDSSDIIRMRLYLSDLTSGSGGSAPSVQWLWESVARTTLYREGLNDTKAPVRLLKSYLTQQADPQSHDDAEWRVLLLFLDIYIFVLRLADDDDFVGAVQPHSRLSTHIPRIQACCLSQDSIKGLTMFLKNFSFALYHDTNSILASFNPPKGMNGDAKSDTASIASAIRLELDGLKTTITTAMQMLYERDSRLRFLPPHHWLMTSRFNMDGFIADAVCELQRQQEADDESDGEEEDDQWPILTLSSSRSHYQIHHQKVQRELARKKRDYHLATIGPKLEILKHMPFVIPFETRANIFKQFIHLDKTRRRSGHVDPDIWRLSMRATSTGMERLGRHDAKIRRNHVLSDAFKQFYPLGEGLKEPISITFIDQFGDVEAGIDGGGVTKEFLISAIDESFSEEQPWFTRNAKGLYYPNPSAMDWFREKAARSASEAEKQELHRQSAVALQKYEFLGRLVGKCVYEGILIDIAFAGFFLMKWRAAGEQNRYRGTVNELRDLDEELYNGLMKLKNETGDVSVLDMSFTIDDNVSFGPDREKFVVTRPLMKGGDEMVVTNDNRLLFISAVARHRLVSQPAQQTNAFIRGLRSVIDPSWLSMFNQAELQRLVGGDSREIDVEDLRRNTIYGGLYVIGDDGLEHPNVERFWRVMASLEDGQRRDVLKFVTSTPRAPLLGFAQLSPLFSIRDGGSQAERLPSASTCINLLKLPVYKDDATLREKLLLAVSSGAGFDLS